MAQTRALSGGVETLSDSGCIFREPLELFHGLEVGWLDVRERRVKDDSKFWPEQL